MHLEQRKPGGLSHDYAGRDRHMAVRRFEWRWPAIPASVRPTVSRSMECAVLNSKRRSPADRLDPRDPIMSASHHPTDIHLRQQRKKKRNKLRARIAAAPAVGRT